MVLTNPTSSFRGGKAVDRRSLRNKVVTRHTRKMIYSHGSSFPRLKIHLFSPPFPSNPLPQGFLLESLRRSCRAKINDSPVFNEIVNYGDAPSVWKAARERILAKRKAMEKSRGWGKEMVDGPSVQLVRTKS